MRYARLITAVVLVAALVAGGYAAWRWSGAGSHAGSAARPQRTPPAGYNLYENATYRFSLFYPSALSVGEYPGEQGTDTFVFEDASTTQAFEVYVLPYGQPQVSEERFAKDNPSGVRDSMQNITIDGATAASFFSSDPRLGDTAEVWVQHNGYLYEVTALKSDAAWLSSILSTWQFIP